MKIERGVLLSDFTTFRIGGYANYFVKAKSVKDVQVAIEEANQLGVSYFILGKGSNTLFDDKGFSGLVILNQITNFVQNDNTFYVGSGYSFPRLGVQTAKLGFTGLEFAAGIPGTVGGAVYMNAGANETDVSKALVSVEYLNEKGIVENLSKEDITFNYRYSSFQDKKGCILTATFQLQAGEEARKKQLQYLKIRGDSQPASDQCAGCIFRNPYIGAAGQLIDELGLKGLSIGGAQISPVHANFIVNKGGGQAKDILALIELIQERAYRYYGVSLKPEIRYIPYE